MPVTVSSFSCPRAEISTQIRRLEGDAKNVSKQDVGTTAPHLKMTDCCVKVNATF